MTVERTECRRFLAGDGRYVVEILEWAEFEKWADSSNPHYYRRAYRGKIYQTSDGHRVEPGPGEGEYSIPSRDGMTVREIRRF